MTLALLLQVVIAAVVLFAVFAFATGWIDPMSNAEPDQFREELPTDLTAADVEQLVLPMAVRGYRMADVDAALEKLSATLAEREAQLAERDQHVAQLLAERHADDTGPSTGGVAVPVDLFETDEENPSPS